MGEELIWKHDPRSIGIMEEEDYFPVIMFGFRVTAYISGPGTKWSGYEVHIKTTDGQEFTVTREVCYYILLVKVDCICFPLFVYYVINTFAGNSC